MYTAVVALVLTAISVPVEARGPAIWCPSY